MSPPSPPAPAPGPEPDPPRPPGVAAVGVSDAAGTTVVDEHHEPHHFAPHVGVVPIHRPSGEDYDAPHSAASTLSSLRQMVASFDAVSDSLLASVDVQSARIDDLERRCMASWERLEALKKLKERGEAATVRAPSSHPSSSAGGGRGRGGGQSSSSSSAAASSSASSSSALSRARIASNRAVYREIVRDREGDDGRAVPSDSGLDRADDDGSDGFGGDGDGGLDGAGGCRRAVDRFRAVPNLAHGARLDEAEAAVETKMGQVSLEGTGERKGDDMLRGLKLGAVNEALRRLQQASRDDGDEYRGGATTRHHRPPRSVGAGGSSANAGARSAAMMADDDDGGDADADADDDAVSILTLDSSFPGATATAAHARQQRRQRQRQRRGQTAAVPSHSPRPATQRRQQAASGSVPYLCELLHDAHGVGDTVPDEASSTRDLFAFGSGGSGRPLYGLGDGVAEEAAVPAEGATASASAAASPRTGAGTRASAAAASGSLASSSLSPLRLLEDDDGVVGGGGVRRRRRGGSGGGGADDDDGGRVVPLSLPSLEGGDPPSISLSASPPPPGGRTGATAASGASAASVASGGGGGGGSSDAIDAAAAIATGGGGGGSGAAPPPGDDVVGLAYRPRALPNDAGRFDMPTNLPLADVAYIPRARARGGIDADDSTSSKNVPEGGEKGD